jgi:threonine dehydrogenase-like Zn-dependent dehydrogenase
LLDATNPIGELEAKTARRLADVVFDAAASPAVAASLCGLVAPTGYVAIIGTYGEPAAVDLQAVMFKELRIVGSRTYLPSDLDAALVLLARDQDQLRPILSGVVAPDALGETFEALRAGEGLKYVVECPT